MDFLARAYWSQGRTRQRVERSFGNSLIFGVYDGTRMVAMARVLSDYTFFAWLCDVFVHEDYRGRRISKWLMESILAHPELKSVRRFVLTTRDAHGLYRQFGFGPVSSPERWMERVQPFPDE